jgi:hypothetical protein
VLAVDVAESKKTVKAFLRRNPRKTKVALMEDTRVDTRRGGKSCSVCILRSGPAGYKSSGTHKLSSNKKKAPKLN